MFAFCQSIQGSSTLVHAAVDWPSVGVEDGVGDKLKDLISGGKLLVFGALKHAAMGMLTWESGGWWLKQLSGEPALSNTESQLTVFHKWSQDQSTFSYRSNSALCGNRPSERSHPDECRLIVTVLILGVEWSRQHLSVSSCDTDGLVVPRSLSSHSPLTMSVPTASLKEAVQLDTP